MSRFQSCSDPVKKDCRNKVEQRVHVDELENAHSMRDYKNELNKPPEYPHSISHKSNLLISTSSFNNFKREKVSVLTNSKVVTKCLDSDIKVISKDYGKLSLVSHENMVMKQAADLKRSRSNDKKFSLKLTGFDKFKTIAGDRRDTTVRGKKAKFVSNEMKSNDLECRDSVRNKYYNLNHLVPPPNGIDRDDKFNGSDHDMNRTTAFTQHRGKSCSPKRCLLREDVKLKVDDGLLQTQTSFSSYGERGRTLKKGQYKGKIQHSEKMNNCNYKIKFERGVMWSYDTNRGKRNGYLLFKSVDLESSLTDSLAQKYGMTFKFSQFDSKLVRIILESHGLSEVNNTSQSFNIYWSNAHFNPTEIRQLQEWQRINHFPRSSELTRKDRLYMNIKRMQRQFGTKLFDFLPISFVLPTEYREFCETHLRERGTWIVKPVASSQGKGIYLVSQTDQVPTDESALISRYIECPLKVDGYKCDLRLYVVVTSLDPLVVYLYEEGLVRLATVKYQNGGNLWNPCVHLTNYSVNKFHSNYVQNEDPEIDDQGSKWSLSALLRHLKSRGIDTGLLMRSIEDVILKSLLSASYQMNTATNMFVPHLRNCFELFGFDILIDSQLKPWILEVNLSPSLNIDQPLDLKIKSSMLSDLFSLIGIPICNPCTMKHSTKPSLYRKIPNLKHSADSYVRSHFGARLGPPLPSYPSHDELRIFKQLHEEFQRRGGWARIMPTPDSWAMYGGLQEYDSPFNLVIHHHFYPNAQRCIRIAPLRISSVSSSGLASSLERLNCYERPLPKVSNLMKKTKYFSGRDESDDSKKDIEEVKFKVLRALESGFALSKYQARMAFSVYLQHVQRRLMIGYDKEQQTDLVYRFLRSAARTLHLPLNVQAPNKSLPSEARAVVISKQLGDFIQAYTKETNLYLDQEKSISCSSLSWRYPTFLSSANSTNNFPLKKIQMAKNIGMDCSTHNMEKNMLDGDASLKGSEKRSSTNLDACICSNNPSYKVKDAILPSHGLKGSSTSNKVDNDFIKTECNLCQFIPLSDLSMSLLSVNHDTTSVAPSSAHVNINNIETSSSYASISLLSKPMSHHASCSLPEVEMNTFISKGNRYCKISPKIFSKSHKLKYHKCDEEDDHCSAHVSVTICSNSSSIQASKCSSLEEENLSDYSMASRQSAQGDGIAMDLYRYFLSNADETSLEEVLSLQTRLHNSVGVFLNSSRRSSRGSAHSAASIPTTSLGINSSFSKGFNSILNLGNIQLRTPNISPHNSPQHSPISPLQGTLQMVDPVTSEPQTMAMTEKLISRENSTISFSTHMRNQDSDEQEGISQPLTIPPSSTCCMFGNILKASLKGTNTSFLP